MSGTNSIIYWIARDNKINGTLWIYTNEPVEVVDSEYWPESPAEGHSELPDGLEQMFPALQGIQSGEKRKVKLTIEVI